MLAQIELSSPQFFEQKKCPANLTGRELCNMYEETNDLEFSLLLR